VVHPANHAMLVKLSAHCAGFPSAFLQRLRIVGVADVGALNDAVFGFGSTYFRHYTLGV